MSADRRLFLEFCAEVTGYTPSDLEGTGLVDEYQALVAQQVGPAITQRLYATVRRVLAHPPGKTREHAMQVDLIASPTLWPVVTSLIQLWYLGSWTSMSAAWYALAGEQPPKGVTPGSSHVPSPQAYVEQLAYRAAGAHPPGAKPTGHGSWAIAPVFGDPVPTEEAT